MTTKAIQYLNARNADFETVVYDHREKGAVFAAEAVGFPLCRTIKTLVVDLGAKRFVLALMPGDNQLSLKKIAAHFGVKRAAMSDTKTAEQITGYQVGGISPFATRKSLDTVIDRRLLAFPVVMVNAGKRGAMLKISPATVVDILGCAAVDISL